MIYQVSKIHLGILYLVRIYYAGTNNSDGTYYAG